MPNILPHPVFFSVSISGYRVGLRCATYLLDVVVAECASILQLLAGENQTLLVRWDPLLILDLALDIVDGVGRLHLEGDSLAREGLDEARGALSVAGFGRVCGVLGLTSALKRTQHVSASSITLVGISTHCLRSSCDFTCILGCQSSRLW